MLIVISPAKTLDYDTPTTTSRHTTPQYLAEATQLIERSRKFSIEDISSLMAVSKKIAELNHQRFAEWHTPFTEENAKQAILAFKGDVYTGLDAGTLSKKELTFAQQHLRILSGLYGLLRPLDLMQAYRLEMGRKINTDKGKNLYEFWGDTITTGLNQQLTSMKSKHLINLASNEYFKSVKTKMLAAEIITPIFKDYKNGDYKIMGVYAKKARGTLSRFIIQNQLNDVEHIKEFKQDGYSFNQQMTEGTNWVFTRKQ